MHKVMITGAGKIGSLAAFLLAHSKDYQVYLADVDTHNANLHGLTNIPNIQLVELDIRDTYAIADFLKKNPVTSLISALPYYCNAAVAEIASVFHLNYFDLTEDVQTTNAIQSLAQHANGAFVPQCGLAPGFISIVANHLMQNFPVLDAVKLRVGALPLNISNALQYSLTWSTDGLINEYGNLCQAIQDNKEVTVLPLDDIEEIKIDGLTYEAFNTSGGVGSLVQTYLGKVRHLSYKTIRYPGHCAKMRLLMNDLKLNLDRSTLKRILETALPKTAQDVVLVYVSVTGTQDNVFVEDNYVKKFYPKKIEGMRWSAIQLTTASALCAVVDMVLSQPGKYQGFVRQEQFSYMDLINNRFGQYYA